MEIVIIAIPATMIIVVALMGIRAQRAARRQGRLLNQALKRYVSKETLAEQAERARKESVA